jgi:hypothetical protein
LAEGSGNGGFRGRNLPDEQAHRRTQRTGGGFGRIARLPEVVVLRHYEGLKFREIGEVLGIPDGTVKTRLSRALDQLNRLLKHVNEDQVCNRKTQTPEVQVR